MSSPEEELRSLRDAVELSPQNVPLRKHYAEALLKLGRLDDAEQEFRQALSLAPNDPPLKLGLARSFYQQGKNSHALVIVEDLVKTAHPPAQAHVLHAKLLLRADEVEKAVREYKKALELDASAADAELCERLGVRPTAPSPNQSVVDGKVRARQDDDLGEFEADIEKPAISFKDVGGMDKLKEEIRMKIIHPLTHPEIYKAYGKSIGGGILMYGPPGCGKTHLARATAGEVKAGFIAVGIHDVLDMWIGSSERNLHALFEQARGNKPCVLFFDEGDALGASRTDMRHSGGRQIINQFLGELDGVNTSNDGVLILAATNAPWHLDSAFRRPGRFDRILFVPPPDAGARAAILRVLLKGKPVDDIDYDHVGKKTEEFSGADLKAVVDVAVEAKLREAMQKGVPTPLSTKDLTAAAKTLRPTTKEWFATARNYALYSNQGGIYDDILTHLKMK
jgi:SpoVK/Ycf46/Vps4 family AAA+-type ATPase